MKRDRASGEPKRVIKEKVPARLVSRIMLPPPLERKAVATPCQPQSTKQIWHSSKIRGHCSQPDIDSEAGLDRPASESRTPMDTLEAIKTVHDTVAEIVDRCKLTGEDEILACREFLASVSDTLGEKHIRIIHASRNKKKGGTQRKAPSLHRKPAAPEHNQQHEKHIQYP